MQPDSAATAPPAAKTPAQSQPAQPAPGDKLPGTALFGSAAAARATAAANTPPATNTATTPEAVNGAAAQQSPAAPAPALQPGEAAAQAAAQLPYGAPPAPAQAISIKGRTDGLTVEIGKGSWAEIIKVLDERLQQSATFFRNAQVAFDVGARPCTEAELAQLVELLRKHGMALATLRTSAERTFQAALAVGLTTTLESAEGAPVADAAPATTNATSTAYFVYRGYLRSGHRLQRKESVLVIGDVNPGAEVVSDGDVLVWGRLRGVVHAGAKGNLRAIVAALDLEPTQLRIADVMTIGPDPRPGQPGKWFWKRSANKRPEVARIVNQAIALDEWDATRPGGLVSLRRGG